MTDYDGKWKAAVALTTGISSASLAAGANALSSEMDNSTALRKWLALELEFTCATAPTAGKAVEAYILPAIDGTNYEDGDATPVDPQKGAQAYFFARAVTTAQRQTRVNILIPPFKFKVLLKSELDKDATGVTLKAYSYGEQINEQ